MADICKKCTLISREFCTFLNLRELSQAVMMLLLRRVKTVDGNKQLSPSFLSWSGLLNHVSELLEAILFKLL